MAAKYAYGKNILIHNAGKLLLGFLYDMNYFTQVQPKDIRTHSFFMWRTCAERKKERIRKKRERVFRTFAVTFTPPISDLCDVAALSLIILKRRNRYNSAVVFMDLHSLTAALVNHIGCYGIGC